MRNYSGIDNLRGLAILAVVAFHYHALPYGYLGVDLFFVISGFLVGGQLYLQLIGEAPWNWPKFMLHRATKIIPSYFVFLLLAGAVSHYLPVVVQSGQSFNWADWKSYFFFYANYRSQGSYLFAHIYSLCIEEHFYLLIPLLILALRWLKLKSLGAVSLAIATGILAVASLRFWLALYGHETIVTSHSRFDSMLLGLLAFALIHSGRLTAGNKNLLLGVGILAFAVTVALDSQLNSEFFRAAFFHGIVPLCVFSVILGLAERDLPQTAWLKWIAKYSYNFYLWHMLFSSTIESHFGPGVLGFLIYFAAGLSLAITATYLVEKPGLKLRKLVSLDHSGAISKRLFSRPQDQTTSLTNS